MKINELSEEEILDFLMNSEFIGDYSPTELKYLLSKWKYFYRLNLAKVEQIKYSHDDSIIALNEKNDKLELLNKEFQVENLKLNDRINLIKSKKLTFKERWFGKIINKDENLQI